MRDRSRRVLIYTAAILIAPLPLVPFERGTPEFRLALLASMALVMAAGAYVIRGEWGRPRPMYATKLLIAAIITAIAAAVIAALAILDVSAGAGLR